MFSRDQRAPATSLPSSALVPSSTPPRERRRLMLLPLYPMSLLWSLRPALIVYPLYWNTTLHLLAATGSQLASLIPLLGDYEQLIATPRFGQKPWSGVPSLRTLHSRTPSLPRGGGASGMERIPLLPLAHPPLLSTQLNARIPLRNTARTQVPEGTCEKDSRDPLEPVLDSTTLCNLKEHSK